MKLDKKQMFHQARNIFLTVIGTLILSFGAAIFLLPFELVTGGVPGLAIVIKALIPVDWLSVDILVTILTWILFFLGLVFLGKDFAAKTLVSSIVFPIGVALFMKLASPDVLGGVLCMTDTSYKELPLILSATVGGAFVGTGCAITFLSGGSTGGVDIIAFLLCKIFKRLKSSMAIFLVDAAIVLSGVFLLHDLVLSFLGVLSAMISAVMVDKIFLGGSSAFVAQIVTEHSEEVNRAIIDQAGRTSTIFEARGGYSGKNKNILTVTFNIRHYTRLMDVVRRADPAAFITIWRAHEIHGEGWTWNKE